MVYSSVSDHHAKLVSDLADPGLSLVDRARLFACRAHSNQKYGDKPYVYHLNDVAKLCAPYGADTVIVAWLHDILEDTDCSFDDLEFEFGALACSVEWVTDPPGVNRKVRKALLYRQLYACSDPVALIVKAADRLANLRQCVSTKNAKLLKLYLDEHDDFMEVCYVPGLCDPLWTEIKSIVKQFDN